MEILLIRHAVAVGKDQGIPDAERPLTVEGLKGWQREVRGLVRMDIAFDAIYYSPLLRAVQTAEPLLPLVRGRKVIAQGLAEKPEPALIASFKGRTIGVVGHEPYL